MRNFVITVNGTSYEVAVEEVEAGAAPVAAAPVAAPLEGPAADQTHDAKVAQVLAAKGATVNTGDVLVVLE